MGYLLEKFRNTATDRYLIMLLVNWILMQHLHVHALQHRNGNSIKQLLLIFVVMIVRVAATRKENIANLAKTLHMMSCIKLANGTIV